MSPLGSRWALCVALVLGVGFLGPHLASAHFVLRSPASWRDQSVLGDPQKVGPCGDEGDAATTGVVTAFAPGETITITLDEVIFHPGHYRVALAVNDRSELPAEPPVTPGTTPCGSVPIMSPAVFPVLADGALMHTEPFGETQSFQVTLPADATCTHCTLQVLEFMSNHAAPCFYHHCADLSIGTGGGSCDTDAECTDEEACMQETCSAAHECVSQPVVLGDVRAGLVDPSEVAACSTEDLPRFAGAVVGKADALLARVAERPEREKRFLRRATKKLRRAAKKVAKVQGRKLSTECATALGALLDQAEARLQCLLADL